MQQSIEWPKPQRNLYTILCLHIVSFQHVFPMNKCRALLDYSIICWPHIRFSEFEFWTELKPLHLHLVLLQHAEWSHCLILLIIIINGSHKHGSSKQNEDTKIKIYHWALGKFGPGLLFHESHSVLQSFRGKRSKPFRATMHLHSTHCFVSEWSTNPHKIVHGKSITFTIKIQITWFHVPLVIIIHHLRHMLEPTRNYA